VPALVVREVSVRYGSRLALASASASVEAGNLVCLVGLNGAGKSTLLKAIVGTVRASGEVSVLGVRDARRRSLLAYVPQREDVSWGFPISVLEVVLMGRLSTLRRLGPDSPADRAAALEALDKVGLADLRKRPIGELSGGQQQRVVIARALFSQAPVVLLDEPLAGVDPGTTQVVLKLLRDLCAAGGTVLMATHDVAGSARVADRVWGINGTVVADVAASRLHDEDVLRSIYGDNLLVLSRGQLAIGDQAR
jgi:ABC-type Mn2+/Zn2+ transport system ATPase subunit